MSSEYSIGKALDQSIVKEIKKRGEVLAKEPKNNEEHIYCYANAPWVCLRSGVYYDGEDGSKSILWGGLRSVDSVPQGFNTGSRDTVNFVYNPSSGKGVRDRGYRPMPGIVGLSVRTESVSNTYGALLSAKVKIKAWSLDDLNILSKYYFKLGFSVLLEWGHSIYLDESGKIQKMSGSDAIIDSKSLWFTKIDGFKSISEEIEKKRNTYNGNYEGLVGLVRNFSYTFEKNGSYDCVVDILGGGSSILDERQNRKTKTPENQKEEGIDKQDDVVKKSPEGALGDIFRHISEAKVFETKKEGPDQIDDQIYQGAGQGGGESDDVTTVRPQENIEAYTCNGEFGDELKTAKHIAFDGIKVLSKKDRGLASDLGESFKVVRINITDGSICNYIKFRDVLWMINKLGNWTTGTSGFDLQTPYRFVSFKGISSLNPRIAVLVYTDPEGEAANFIEQNATKLDGVLFDVPSGREWNEIGNIWLNVEYLSNVLLEISNGNTLTAKDFISKIIIDLDVVLGELSDFTIAQDAKEHMVIVDRNWIGDPDTGQDVAENAIIPSTGLKSTITNISAGSEITNEIASMFSIAASEKYEEGNSNFRADVRILKIKKGAKDYHQGVDNVEDDKVNKPNEGYFKKAIEEAYEKIRGADKDGKLLHTSIVDTGLRTWSENLGPSGQLIYNKIITSQPKTNYFSQDGLIPVKVSFTMKGISRILVGNVFMLEPGFLPEDYDNWRYMVTNVEHSISTKGWETSIKTQYYLGNG